MAGPIGPTNPLDQSRFAEREVRLSSFLVSADNHMIKKAELHQLSGLINASGKSPIGLTWRGISRRMIVNERESIAPGEENGSQHFASCCEALVERSQRNYVPAVHSQPGVEADHHEKFLVRLEGGFGLHCVAEEPVERRR